MSVTDLLIASKATALEPVYAEGEVGPLSMNRDGRLRVAAKPAIIPIVSGQLTLAGSTAANVLYADVRDVSNLVLTLNNPGSAAMTAGTFVFEASLDSTDGVNGIWVNVQAVRSNVNLIDTNYAGAGLAAGAAVGFSWRVSVNGYSMFRIRCSVTLTTNSIGNWTIGFGSYATEAAPAVPSHQVSVAGTVTTQIGNVVNRYLLSAASTNSTLVKGSAGQITELTVSNPTATAVYVKLYDKATAPTIGTDAPIATIPVAAGAFVSFDFGALGKRFSTGIGLGITANAASSDTTAAVAGVIFHCTYV